MTSCTYFSTFCIQLPFHCVLMLSLMITCDFFFKNTIQSHVTVLCLVVSPVSAAHAQDLTKICLKLPCSHREAVTSPCLLVGAGSAGILGNLGAVFLGAVTGHCDSASSPDSAMGQRDERPLQPGGPGSWPSGRRRRRV